MGADVAGGSGLGDYRMWGVVVMIRFMGIWAPLWRYDIYCNGSKEICNVSDGGKMKYTKLA